MSSDTPRADAHNWNDGHYDDPLHSLLDFAKQLERELNAANERIKRLEEAGDKLDSSIACGCGVDGPCRTCRLALAVWQQAKEDKP